MAPASPSPASEPRVWVLNPARAGLLGWLFRYYAFVIAAALVAAAIAAHAVYRAYAADLPDLTEIAAYETSAPGVTRIVAADGALLAEIAREHRAYAGYGDIPPRLVHAFLAAEDRRFFAHGGLDWRGLARATLANLRSGTVVQGGSTITQQVAKGFLSQERTLDRKLREAILSLRLESRLGKERILEIYLNKIFLGHGAYGVAAAASRYFGKRLDELTLAESALIAGLARAPSRYSPVSSPEAALKRRAVVLQAMVDAGYITPDERDRAQGEPLHLVSQPDVFRQRLPYYAEHVRRAVIDLLGEERVLQDGLRIETPAELPAGALAHAAIQRAVRRLDRRQGWRGPVAHLPRPEGREALLDRLRAAYGPAPLAADPQRWRLALVESVEPRQAVVALGDQRALLPLRAVAWAAPYDRNSPINDQRIDRVNAALEVGDVVWVRPARLPRAVKPAKGAPDPAAAADDDEPLSSRLDLDPATGLPVVALTQSPRIEAALYTLDHRSGYVTVMEGGADYDRSQFNRAVQACRQPGSVFKAIYYSLALDGEWRMDSVLEDKPYEPEPGEVWNPQNLGKTLDGKVLLRTALIRSLNLPSIRLFQALGADAVVAWARRLGFRSELIADRALSLGASCVHTDELVRAFAIFARGGTWIDPIYVRRVVDKNGTVLLDQRAPDDPWMDLAGRLDRMGTIAAAPPRQVIDERTAFLITRLLREVVTAGIGYHAQHIGVPAAGKSGTASKRENTTDTWFVGFTSRQVTAAWMGDDAYERSMGAEDASYTTATPLWTDYMKGVVAGVPHDPLPARRPPGLGSKTIDARTGKDPLPDQLQATIFYKE